MTKKSSPAEIKIKSADFSISCSNVSQAPGINIPEYAFIGRSNVGKSSLINAVVGRKGLAKTSAKPGKTQLINYFLVNKAWHLVDLPGYGWASVSKKMKEDWGNMIRSYFLKREQLACTFLLIDSRIEAQQIDLDMMEWFAQNGIPFIILMTKCDKQGLNKAGAAIAKYKKKLAETWDPLPEIIATSSETNTGVEQILSFIDSINKSTNYDVSG